MTAVSIVIPTFDGGDMLTKCVAHLTSGLGSIDYELLLVDNASSDGSIEAACNVAPSAKVIRNEENRGYAPACNQGAMVATGDWLLFLNNDVTLSRDAVPKLLAAISDDENIAIVQPAVWYEGHERLASLGSNFTITGCLWHLQAVDESQPHTPVFAANGACMMVRRDVFEQVGGFDDAYFAYFEDTDLNWKARLAGWEAAVVPTVRVEHLVGATSSRRFDPAYIDYLSFRNRWRTLLANLGTRELMLVVPAHVFTLMVTAAAFAVQRNWASAKAIVDAALWPLRNSGEVRSARRHAKSLRTFSDRRVLRRELRHSLTVGQAIHAFMSYVPRKKNSVRTQLSFRDKDM